MIVDLIRGIEMSNIPVDEYKDPVAINEEDFAEVRQIQVLVETLNRYRQEMGRLLQLLGNLREEANKTEVEMAERRRSLAHKYNLEKIGTGQWALDFENKEFVKAAPGTPPIP